MGVWLFVAMTLVAFVSTAQAVVKVKERDKPIGTITALGGVAYQIDVEKTGVVVRLDLGQRVPVGTLAWLGTGRQPPVVRTYCSANPGVCQKPFHLFCEAAGDAICRQVQDVSISCHNAANQPFCSSLRWVHREADGEMNGGTVWAEDEDVLKVLRGEVVDPDLAKNIRQCEYKNDANYRVTCRVELQPNQKRHQSWFGAYDPKTGQLFAGYQPQRGKVKVDDDGQGNPHTVIGDGPAQPRMDQPSTKEIGFGGTPKTAPAK
ncbi:MAG: hypothetical protein ABI747_03995 [Candidatus Moraniibacteriota bacterium]